MAKRPIDDKPAFRMIVKGGRLEPASAFDAERLDTWRNGTIVHVFLATNADRRPLRKWWAILNRAVKECRTPWKSAVEASDALKLALGMVNPFKTISGAWSATTKSLTEYDDPELDEFCDLMMDVLYHMTGVDPARWREMVGGEMAKDDKLIEGELAAQQISADAGDAFDEAMKAEFPDKKPDVHEEPEAKRPDATTEQRRECVTKFLQLVADPQCSLKEKVENLAFAKEVWKKEIHDDQFFVLAVLRTSEKVLRKETPPADARRYLESLI